MSDFLRSTSSSAGGVSSWILAPARLTAGLLQRGLPDELRIMVNPVILSQGRSLFAGAGKTALKLLKTRQFTSGNVLLYCQPITR